MVSKMYFFVCLFSNSPFHENIKIPQTEKKIYNQESGVRHRTLPLVEENGSGGCPKEKVMSKKCKGEKKNKNKKKKKSKKEKHGDKQGEY